MMKLFLQQAPPRFKDDNLKMFGKNWFDPQDACALRESVKPIILEELKREPILREMVIASADSPHSASRIEIFGNSFGSPSKQLPIDDDKLHPSAEPGPTEKDENMVVNTPACSAEPTVERRGPELRSHMSVAGNLNDDLQNEDLAGLTRKHWPNIHALLIKENVRGMSKKETSSKMGKKSLLLSNVGGNVHHPPKLDKMKSM